MAEVNYDAENPFEEEPLEQPAPKTNTVTTPPLPPKQSTAPPSIPPKSSSNATTYPTTTFDTSFRANTVSISNSNTNSNSNVDPSLLRDAERLRQKELELNQREAAINMRAEQLAKREKMGLGPREPNWPPFRPLVYQNMDEIPSNVQYLVKRAYWGFLASSFCLLWNVVCMCTALGIFGSGQSIGDMILSFVYFIFLIPIWFWIYRMVYKAARREQPSRYLAYLLLFFFVVLSDIFFAIGIPGTGAGGFIYMIKAFEKNIAGGCIMLVGGAFWVLIGLWNGYQWLWARAEYSKAGGTEKAKKEAASTAINEAKNHPELVTEGVKFAAQNPELIMHGAQSV